MEIDTPHVTKKIVALLMDSFTPTDQGYSAICLLFTLPLIVMCISESNIKSCLFLLESNPIAAWKFYQYSLSTLSVREAGMFLIRISSCIIMCNRIFFNQWSDRTCRVVL